MASHLTLNMDTRMNAKTFSLFVGTATLLFLIMYQAIETGGIFGNSYLEDTFSISETEGFTYTDLLNDYMNHIHAMKTKRLWKRNSVAESCDTIVTGLRKSVPCIDTKCDAKVATDPEASLAGILESMTDLEEDTLAEVTRLLRTKHTHKQVLFVTAASSNHFKESQALIHNLNEYVFPLLTNYSFVFYDLGLNTEERSELEQFCGCEVRTFPLSMMPDRIKPLTCYTWKPLIVHANLPRSDVLFWVDASVRFKRDAITELLRLIKHTKVVVNSGVFPIGEHATVDMFNYFRESACSFSAIPEFQANFIALKNELLVREAVVKPWAACALSPFCMCPVDHTELLHCDTAIRRYNKCHRFDQSALGIILVKLFRNHDVNIRVEENIVRVKRNQIEKYFEALKENSNPLFRNFG